MINELKPGYRLRILDSADGYGNLKSIQNQLGFLTVKELCNPCGLTCPNCNQTTVVFKESKGHWCHIKDNAYIIPLKITKPISFRQHRSNRQNQLVTADIEYFKSKIHAAMGIPLDRWELLSPAYNF